jgi:tetratricopeptide (TPR) repeat protein
MNFDAWRHCLRGRLMSRLRRPEAAIRAYLDALAADPVNLRAVAALGYLYAQAKRYDLAEPYLVRAVELAPGRADLWFNLGYAQDAAGRHAAAIESFEAAVRLDPKLDRAWYGMGLAHAALGRHREAARCFGEASALQPMNGHAWYALGMAWHHSREPDKVKEVAEHMVRFDPQLTRKLIQETGRADLAPLVAHLAGWGR